MKTENGTETIGQPIRFVKKKWKEKTEGNLNDFYS